MITEDRTYVVIAGGEVEFEDSSDSWDLGEGACIDAVREGEERAMGVAQSTGVQCGLEVDGRGNEINYDLG